MERSTTTLPFFVEFSLSLIGFLLLVCMFFYHGKAGQHATGINTDITVVIGVSQ